MNIKCVFFVLAFGMCTVITAQNSAVQVQRPNKVQPQHQVQQSPKPQPTINFQIKLRDDILAIPKDSTNTALQGKAVRPKIEIRKKQ